MSFKFIEDTLAEKYPNINTDDYIWKQLINTPNEYDSGWHDIIIELVIKIEEAYRKNYIDISDFKIDQIKEKYGELRFDAISSLQEVYVLISEYEEKADSVCDECGGIGYLCEKNGWLETLCEKCASEKGYKKVE